MKTIIACTLLFFLLHVPASMLGQATTTVIWQVNSFDLNVNVQQEQRLIGVTATLNATNVGNGTGRKLEGEHEIGDGGRGTRQLPPNS
jgi:hypothetical protein